MNFMLRNPGSMPLVRLHHPSFKTLGAAVNVVKKHSAPEYSHQEVAVAFPLLNAPTLAQLKSMGRINKVEMGVEIDLVANDHLVIFGCENNIQFTGRPYERFFKVHSHPESETSSSIILSNNDLSNAKSREVMAVVTSRGIGFGTLINACLASKSSYGSSSPFANEKWFFREIISEIYAEHWSFSGCDGLGNRPYQFLSDPEKEIFPPEEVLSLIKNNEETKRMEVLKSLGFPSISFVRDDCVNYSQRHWFLKWSDMAERLNINLRNNNVAAFINNDGTFKDPFDHRA